MRKLTTLLLLLVSFSISVAQITILSTGATYGEDFNSMSSTAKVTIPSGFKIGTNWSTGLTTTDTSAGTTGSGSLSSTSKGYCYNFGNGLNSSATDRALGILCTNSYTGKSIVMKITNNSGFTINQLYLSWDYEKYRSGSRQWNITFYSGTSTNPTTAQTAGDQSYSADANNTVIYNPPTVISKYVVISSISIPDGSDYYLRWAITGVGGNTNGQALAIDNFKVSVGDPTLPIELGEFTAEQKEKINLINWETLSEDNMDKFLLQRSYNGLLWEDVTYVPAYGNSTYIREYSVSDLTYNQNENIIYYRLLSYDYSGLFQTSYVIMLKNEYTANPIKINYYNMFGQEVYPEDSYNGLIIYKDNYRVKKYFIIR